MKKYLIIAFTAVLAVGAALMFGASPDDRELSALALENIEALSQGEDFGDRIPCHSQSEWNPFKSYVDCASCERKKGWNGYGTEALCTR